jgi:hypothetical protein
MSSRSNVRTSISEMVDFIREKASANIVEASRRGDFSLDDNDLRKVLSLLELSFSQAYSQAYTGVERALDELN